MQASYLRRLVSIALLFTVASSMIPSVSSWSNGGYSTDPSNPDYGTHDWLADHALDWLPVAEKQWILNHKAAYLFGTELPDRSGCGDCFGDTANHHVYYHRDGSLQDEAAAARAKQVYDQALAAGHSGNWSKVTVLIGAMTHYIDDLAVFGHVMGAATDWGAETHHSDFENYVNARTSTYVSEFTAFLTFDGNLSARDPYDASLILALDTTFGGATGRNATWMDQHYGWSNSEFRSRVGESLNLAVNYLADVLHGFWLASGQPIPEFSMPLMILIVAIIAAYCTSRTGLDGTENSKRHRVISTHKKPIVAHEKAYST